MESGLKIGKQSMACFAMQSHHLGCDAIGLQRDDRHGVAATSECNAMTRHGFLQRRARIMHRRLCESPSAMDLVQRRVRNCNKETAPTKRITFRVTRQVKLI
mmetsp:Transcript_7325/g.19813  ORF Transcript_7325/g.19813 Transcript_7325/m.19813 type:complete len:102 (-) Transcript_7325:31-336(-)